MRSPSSAARTEDLSTGTPGPVLRGHWQSIHEIAFTPDVRHVVTAAGDGTVGATGERLRRLPLRIG